MSNVTKTGVLKRGAKRWYHARGYPKWQQCGMWFYLPESLLGISSCGLAAEYTICIEALIRLRKYLSEADPFLIAVEIDNIRLCELCENGSYWTHKRKRPLTTAEKQFVLGWNHV